MVVIRADNVIVDEDDPEFILIGFGEEADDSPRYLMLQRSYEFDAQDIELGMDDVYIERDDPFWSAYGGILRFELERHRVRVQLDAETTEKLGGTSEYEVRFDLDDRKFAELREGLNKVFRGFDCFVEEIDDTLI